MLTMLITRDQAYNETMKVIERESIAISQLTDITALIRKAILDGEFTVRFNAEPSNIVFKSVLDTLESNEYNVHKINTNTISVSWNKD